MHNKTRVKSKYKFDELFTVTAVIVVNVFVIVESDMCFGLKKRM